MMTSACSKTVVLWSYYLDSDPNLPDITEEHEVINCPVITVGAGGYEFDSVGRGVVNAWARDTEDKRRRVRIRCTAVPGLGSSPVFDRDHAKETVEHDFITRTRMELPDFPDGTPGFDLGPRNVRMLCYLDLTVDFSRGTSVRGSAAPYRQAQEEAAGCAT